MNLSKDDDSCSSDDSDVAFAYMDFTGVDFGGEGEEEALPSADETEVSPEKNACSTPGVAAEEKTRSENISNDKPAVQNDTFMANQALEDGVKNLMGGEEEKGDSFIPNAKLSAEMETINIPKVQASPLPLDEESKLAVEEERKILLKDCYWKDDEMMKDVESSGYESVDRIREIAKQLSQGHYMDILSGQATQELFSHDIVLNEESDNPMTVVQRIRHCVLEYCTSVAKCVEIELVAVAALNLFMQPNYTGPSLHHGGVSRPGKEEETYEALKTVNPHPLFCSQLKVSSETDSESKSISNEEVKEAEDKQHEPPVDVPYHNAVLAELSMDGEWPCPVCKYPYFLLLARSILSTLAVPNRPDWTQNILHDGEKELIVRKSSSGNFFESPKPLFVACAQNLFCAPIWCGRAIVAHCRLLQGDEPSMTLWKEAKHVFDDCVTKYCDTVESTPSSAKEERTLASKVMLEYGLAEHHFDREKKGKPYFRKALAFADLDVEVTGSEGKRTKYQEKATPQMLVRAKPTQAVVADEGEELTEEQKIIEGQEIKLADDSILLNRVKYTTEDDNVHFELNIHQQTVLLALCLDVKNDNPMDGLTGEQMGAFLERVLQQHDDWMVYATGLLERAWLESEWNHTRERALLQLQA